MQCSAVVDVMTRSVTLFLNVGDVFGRLTVTALTRKYIPSVPKGRLAAICTCTCGKEITVTNEHLISGHTQSCGCLRDELSSERVSSVETIKARGGSPHGLTNHPHYNRWNNMMARCYNSKRKYYKDYGGRGIKVHPDWHDLTAFCTWLDNNLGQCPEGYSLDRINNDGNYEPGNVRWADASTQCSNRTRA